MQDANKVESESPTNPKALKTEQGKTIPPTMCLDLGPFQIFL